MPGIAADEQGIRPRFRHHRHGELLLSRVGVHGEGRIGGRDVPELVDGGGFLPEGATGGDAGDQSRKETEIHRRVLGE